MVFCNTRKISDFVEGNLRSNGINAATIHGGLTQNKRLKTIDRFNSSEVNVLVCTDVASRGLHIKNVSHVINYDLPKDPNDYIHRIGRTARAGESGQVINLLTDFDRDILSKIKKLNKTFNIEDKELTEFRNASIFKIKADSGRRRKDHDPNRHKGQNSYRENGHNRDFYGKKKRTNESRHKSRKNYKKGTFQYNNKWNNPKHK